MKHFLYEKSADSEDIYDIFSHLMRDRILFIGTEIDSDMANSIIAQLLWLDSKDSKTPIDLYINSPGGEVHSMFAIYDIMQAIEAPIRTYVIGLAASAAAVLLSAGSPGMRYALPNSAIMVHQPSGYTEGSVSDMKIEMEQMAEMKKKLVSLLAKHSGNSLRKMSKLCDRDAWLDPKEAVKLRIIDHIKEPSKTLAVSTKTKQ